MLAIWHENDRYSFEDSERFEEDSLCTWSSEPESACINWRGWRKMEQNTEREPKPEIKQLVELAAQCIALFVPYELVEQEYPPVPEELQLRIAFWSFPDSEDDIRLYSCLANSNSDEFIRGQNLYSSSTVKDCVQIGFHLSANVNHGGRSIFNVAITFDRKKITSCNCTCEPMSYWCCHVVAVCLHRIYCPDQVLLRAPVSESLSRLERDQLQKFAQYLISELPQQILPAAQRLLDSLLSSQPTVINSTSGAPDPTAGASINEQTSWFLDEKTLHNNIKKSLIKFCVPSPLVISDVNILSQSVPPATAEWSNLLRPLRGREPEGLWNLVSIVREMFRRNDENAMHLLEVLTEEAVACDQIMIWWFNTRVALHGSGPSGVSKHTGPAGNTNTASHACALLCDEMVTLWRLAALNPSISPDHRVALKQKFQDWQGKIFSRVVKHRNTSNSKALNHFRQDMEIFVGFKPASEACDLDWDDYPLPGITYGTTCCCDNNGGCCSHINNQGATIHFMGEYGNWNECSASSRGNSGQISLDECFLDLKNNRHLHYGNRTSRTDYRRSNNMHMLCNVHMPNNEHRQMTNVYWVHMSRSMSRTQPEGGNASASIPEPFPASEPSTSQSLASIPSTSSSSTSTTQPSSPQQVAKPLSSSSESQSSDEGDRLAVQKSTSSQTTPPPQDGDDCHYLYYCNPKKLPSTSSDSIKIAQEVNAPDIYQPSTSKSMTATTPLIKLDSEWETMFARAEGLYAYGHTKEACVLGVELVDKFLKNPPDFIIDVPPPIIKGKRRKINPVCHQLSILASEILQKCYFLCSVLAERKEYYLHAFKIGLYGLEMPRLPASTKPLEVKMAHQEAEILNHLKRMLPFDKPETKILRERAILLREGQYKTRGDSLLPLNLATFIFDCLVLYQSPSPGKTDESLGFEAAVAVLGMKANISEAENPLLCEGIRRQRGELALNIIIRYKNNPTRLAFAMDKLLDREVHPFMKSAMDACWYQIRDSRTIPIMAMKNIASSNLVYPQFPNYNPTATGVPGELDTNLASMNLNSAPPTPSSSSSSNSTGLSSSRKDRYKSGKRIYPNQPNQASEANAHFLFELGKIILSKVGGPVQTTVFTQPPLSSQPHRALHMCAFQLSLYSLGLLNRVSPNWRSRNYSSQVTWIGDHAMEIGAPATLFLLATWEGHLTPAEVANIADRMSRSHERVTVEAAAQLSLSCLRHSAALNLNEITRAILQCKEQNEHMMEIALLYVEMSAKNGGVFPEVLFSVAKHWFDLYIRHSNSDEDNYLVQVDPREEYNCPFVYQANYQIDQSQQQQPLYAHQLLAPPQTAPPHMYLSSVPYFTNQSVTQTQPPSNSQQSNTVMLYPFPSLPTSTQFSQYYSPYVQFQNSNTQNQSHQGPPPQYFVQSLNQNGTQVRSPPQQAQGNHRQSSNYAQIQHLTSAYRVGMLALDSLARRVHEPNQAKYSRNPPFRDDIQWLLRLSKKLGVNYTQQFCMAVTNSVVNPFILHDVAMEAVLYMAHYNPSPTMCPSLSPLVEKCHTMYIQLLHQKLYQLSSSDYEDYVSILYSAYGAFAMTSEGTAMFKDWLQSVRRSKSCKKELWAMINNVLPTT
ncbi:zinc finger SWIM domain-containing protein 8 homolog isoform X2 [Adelges cooleyi]|uniref:zinc finger SWIM domain-containing protein 8 homolog isoform X2 n=1 Tax=Adelges cooleyi TaxID=133065 RepID=UPI0021805245|nr:zinc finger SWIM domain-containing protein 8 homolog isoform X2 [Adelges cooleyi]XP_050442655.1 zinc finger SWIM domain-containing protein 8 homolog isoform X2 [Adelges cooleyi]